MQMISYAHNREDVLLRRIFPEPAKGFYIDIGAGDPENGSLTRHFYGRGWYGINAEPSKLLFDKLTAERPNDINLRVAVSNREGQATFYEFDEAHWGFSTLSEEQARRHAQSGLTFTEHQIATTTLARICEENAGGAIDFLSIDVEGHEQEVIEGGDWRTWRPKVLVVESTLPMTKIPSHDSWEPLLLDAAYMLAAFDGLNRYYVRSEDAALAEHLSTPVNVLDDFVAFEHILQIESFKQELERLHGTVAALQVLNQDLKQVEPLLWQDLEYFKRRFEDLEAGYRAVSEGAVPQAQAPSGSGMPEEVGPLAMAVARRLSQLAHRYPKAATVARRVLLTGNAIRKRLKPHRP
jgi:FkbM family methyltransferase